RVSTSPGASANGSSSSLWAAITRQYFGSLYSRKASKQSRSSEVTPLGLVGRVAAWLFELLGERPELLEGNVERGAHRNAVGAEHGEPLRQLFNHRFERKHPPLEL